MSDNAHAPQLQSMIDRAGRITPDEGDALATLWESDEDIVLPEASVSLAIQGGADAPMVTNAALVAAWEHALRAAGDAGRVDEIEAAQAAGRAVKHALPLGHDRSGAEEAVRSAVLAVGVRDLVAAEDVDVLTAVWRRVLGEV